jgi:hypothetical protein
MHFIFSDLNHKMVISWSLTESTPKHFFFRKKALGILKSKDVIQWQQNTSFFQTILNRKNIKQMLAYWDYTTGFIQTISFISFMEIPNSMRILSRPPA